MRIKYISEVSNFTRKKNYYVILREDSLLKS